VGLFRRGQDARDFFIPLLCRGQAAAPTLAHVLFQLFLESGFRNWRSSNPSFKVVCPDANGEHSKDFFVGYIPWESVERGLAKCECGTNFRFRVDDKRLVVKKVSR
jgi:hypothetical protein